MNATTGSTATAALIVFAIVTASLTTALLPLTVAGLYGVPHKGRIAVLSLLLGWTGVAWLAALFIAVYAAARLASQPPSPKVVVDYTPPARQNVPAYPAGWGPR